MFNNQVFNLVKEIPASTRVVFVADMYVDQYVGGAELTTEAIIESSPVSVFKIKSTEVTHELLKKHTDKHWIFGNFSQLNPQLIPSIVGNLKYSILEYDFKYCSFRSPEKHFAETGLPCDCHNMMHGKMISAMYHGAKCLFWMSEKQKERYMTMFPFLADQTNIVLSSVFSKQTLGAMALLRDKTKNDVKHGWIVLGSPSWIKGAEQSENWCKTHNKEYKIIWNVPYDQMLSLLAASEGLVYLPMGGDTCPRNVIEAKLLGCKLHLNDFVLHKDEEWFQTNDLESIQEYLFTAPGLFWQVIRKIIDYNPTISGYLTTYNCISQEYPYEQCISSMLSFCDEVVVLDGGSTDGTFERINALTVENKKVVVDQIKRDMTHPRSALFDGMQKAEARKRCTGEFCWQMDADEIVHENDATKIVDMCKKMPKEVDVVSLPVVEFWGSTDKVRCDINLAKWRLSRNKPNITHGIPVDQRKIDENGQLYALPGTDGCCMIDIKTGERIGHVTFVTPEVENVRREAANGNKIALQELERWFNTLVENVPGVYHYSWVDFKRKIKLYRDTWQRHWLSLYNLKIEDTAENNMFFDCPWSEVTEEMIEIRANDFSLSGGHIFHRKFDKNITTPWITVARKQPKIMER